MDDAGTDGVRGHAGASTTTIRTRLLKFGAALLRNTRLDRIVLASERPLSAARAVRHRRHAADRCSMVLKPAPDPRMPEPLAREISRLGHAQPRRKGCLVGDAEFHVGGTQVVAHGGRR
jgi:hypothetical protein